MPDNIQVKDAAGTNRTMRTIETGGVHMPVHAGYDAFGQKLLVGSARAKLRDNFLTFDTANTWELVQTGPGMIVSTAGAANGSRYLNIASGTTINAETILVSRETFRMPVKAAAAISLSQRIAGTEVYVEFVSVDAVGNVETDTTFASVDTNNALNCAGWKIEGTTATSARYLVRADGVSDLLSPASTITTTAATGTAPNFIAAGILEINIDTEDMVFSTRAVDSMAAHTSYKRTMGGVDPNKDYKLRLRVRNLGVAPASGTDVRFHFVRIVDTTRLTVDMSRHFGRSDPSNAIPVIVAQIPTTLVQGAAAIDAAFGTPLPVAFRAANANPTAMSANGDTVGPLATMIGALVTKANALPEADWTFTVAAPIANTTDVLVRTAGAAGIRNHVTALQLKNTNAVATEVQVKDGATVIWRGHLSANMTSADIVELPTPLRGSPATALNIACVTTGASVYASLQGFQAP
jgi:hypothetical protein